jgi:hypothetical protein
MQNGSMTFNKVQPKNSCTLSSAQSKTPRPATQLLSAMPGTLHRGLRALAAGGTLFAAVALGMSGDETPKAQPFLWSPVGDVLPESVKVFEGFGRAADGSPLRAWYADIDYSDRRLQLRSFLSNDVTGKEALTSMAKKTNAIVAINGGYFDMQSVPAKTYSLVRSGSQTLVPSIRRITRRNGFYYVGRSAFGVRADRTFDIQWIYQTDNAIYQMPAALPNSPLGAAAEPTPEQLQTLPTWQPVEAMGAGPMLLRAGYPRVTYNEEVFFGAGYPRDLPYPRSAVGYTAGGHLILFVVDGSQPLSSIGLTLDELAAQMKLFGCTDAMNLDGGGSSTMTVNGRLLNSPSGGTWERRVTSALTLSTVNE